MEYTVNKLAKLSGVSTRTLRYYDQIGLLTPQRVSSNGYRIYGRSEVDTLQQILIFRELGVNLEDIKSMLPATDTDRERTLAGHLDSLIQKRMQLDTLIDNVTKTINSLQGGITMSDKEKFEGLKKRLVENNEQAYGADIRKSYGDSAIDASNAKVMGMSQADWERTQALSEQIAQTIKAAMEQGDPTGELAQEACDLHRQWLMMFWQDGAYSKQSHLSLAQMYVADERFTAYYEKIAVGATQFLYNALEKYCK